MMMQIVMFLSKSLQIEEVFFHVGEVLSSGVMIICNLGSSLPV
jgi:hypothetical protein